MKSRLLPYPVWILNRSSDIEIFIDVSILGHAAHFRAPSLSQSRYHIRRDYARVQRWGWSIWCKEAISLPRRAKTASVKSYDIVIIGLSRCIDPPRECSTPTTSEPTPPLNSHHSPRYRVSVLSTSLAVSSLNLVVIGQVGDEIGPKAAGVGCAAATILWLCRHKKSCAMCRKGLIVRQLRCRRRNLT